MKKLTCFVVGLLFLGSFAAISIDAGENEETTINLQFMEPKIGEKIIDGETYIELDVEGASARLYQAGKPALPYYTTTMRLPFGTKITDIQCITSEIETLLIKDKIMPAPKSVPLNVDTDDAEFIMDESIYSSEELFPQNWFDYYTGGGIDTDKQRKTFLTIRVYPVRYSPATDTIYYIDDFDLKITYETPESDPFPENGEYDMVVIAPLMFSSQLRKLINHKNDLGISTTFKSTASIYLDSMLGKYDEKGRDKPEMIKYFIKYAIDNWNIKYVLLVGGMKSPWFGKPKDDRNQGTKSWYVPVRYTNLRDPGSVYDPGYISDLYYADIYDGVGDFSSWDSNDDDIFAKWDNTPGKDVIDFYPDVSIGRLACRNLFEVKIMVDKIIKYEQGPADPTWYDTMVVVAGDSHDDPGTNYLEGELVCDKALTQYMTEFDPVRLFASYKDTDPDHTPVSENIIREISAGCGHLFFEGHANPGSWNTHWPFPEAGWTGGIQVEHFPSLKNGDKLPVCVVGGCHNSQFNVTALSTMLDTDGTKHTWCYGSVTPECWSWWLTRKIGGGAIATVGNTGLGYGAVGENGDIDGDGINEPDCLEAVGGYQCLQFYKTFDEGVNILGDVWSGALEKYLETFPGMADQIDAKTVQEWALLGDPSLRIGGGLP